MAEMECRAQQPDGDQSQGEAHRDDGEPRIERHRTMRHGDGQ